ncbi:MAG: leucine-rich repeat domain-containing protein [Lachnospiraceae bacterium]|nr:leucine-rich repeat domain-containing protein [Lachnospiraceae bacterium]
MRFEYSVKNNEAVITGGSDIGTSLVIPEMLDGVKVTAVERKAFLGIKGLRSVTVPESVNSIGDWAFAQCIHLREVSIGGAGAGKLGKGVFEGCTRLESLHFDSNVDADSDVMAAMTVHRLEAEYLLRDPDLGTENWYRKWDLALANLLARDDMEGYSDRALCGEEDISYDGIGSVDGELPGESASYIIEQNKNKCYLCLVRLMNAGFLDKDTGTLFKKYLKRHAKGCGNESAWLTVKEDFKDNIEYLKLFIDVTEPDSDAIKDMIADAGNLAELKAYLIGLNADNAGVEGFFDDLLL